MPRLFDGLELPASADFHVHLRDGEMMEAVTPTIRQGGVDTVFVMPNLIPPITTLEHSESYTSKLRSLAPNVTFLPSLYLHPSITPALIPSAKASGIYGIKSYPAGVTTNSASGVHDYTAYHALFAAMETHDLVLNLHGEVPASHSPDTTVLNAEPNFLPTLLDLHARFPQLRIVLEHCTTAAAIEAVSSCGPTVVATITAHHLSLTVDDWAGDPLHYCKPVAKLPSDRVALLRAATSGNPKFFLGTDSAPHGLRAKRGVVVADGDGTGGKCAAGVFTQPYATQLVLEAFERAVEMGLLERDRVVQPDVLEGFLGRFGRAFYRIPPSRERIFIGATEEVVVKNLRFGAKGEGQGGVRGDIIVPFRSGQPIYSLQWI